MNLPVKEFLRTPKGQLTAAVAALAASQLFLFFFFFGEFLGTPPSPAQKNTLKQERDRSRQSLAAQEKEQKRNDELRRTYRKRMTEVWQESRHGSVETQMRQKVSAKARELEFRLHNIGAVRTGRINGEFFYADLDLSGSGSLEEVTRFLLALRTLDPVPGWRRLDLRPDRSFQQQTKAGSANLAGRTDPAVNATRLNFNGTLRVLGYDGKALPAPGKGGKK